MKNTVNIQEVNPSLSNRRGFLKLSGLAIAGTGLLLAGCSDTDDASVKTDQLPGQRNGIFDLGGGDFGILSYAYALEQLEADFYTKVVNATGFTSTFNDIEQQVLVDLYHHEVIHRDFFQAALTKALPNPSTQLLPTLEFDYGSLNFQNRAAVLGTAQALEDTGVAAYNGAGQYIKDVNYLLLAGKIVSVEARHASAIRSLINPNSKDFAGDDVVSTDKGLDQARNPKTIIGEVVSLDIIQTPFTANFLP